jgi:acyl-coenzyme A thioesterase PaaI-like protein
MELLPKVFTDMEGVNLLTMLMGILIARFPNKERYINPFGFMQGGIIVAAIDNTVASLSYLLAPPNISKEISAVFKWSVTRDDRYIDVIASLIEKISTQ